MSKFLSRLRRVCNVLSVLPKAPGFCVFVIGAGTLTIFLTFQIPYPKFLPSEVLGTLIGTGITLMAIGLNDIVKFYGSTADLEGLEVYLPEVFRLSEKYVAYRISVLVRNSGSVAVRDAKAVMKLEDPDPKTFSKILVQSCHHDCALSSECQGKPYLANKANPAIRGEPLPWSIPERPIGRPAYVELIHPIRVEIIQKLFILIMPI